MIQVIKRNRWRENFDCSRLRLCFWRALGSRRECFMAAHHFSRAIEIYLIRRRCREVTSAAIFEMAVLTLSRSDCQYAADALEQHRELRSCRRKQFVITDPGSEPLLWDRRQLTTTIAQRWDISPASAAVISAELEDELIYEDDSIDLEDLLDFADELVENFGLAPWCLLSTLGGN